MRKFFALSAGLAVCGTAFAGEKPAPQTVDNGIKVLPQRIATIGADFRLTSEWYDYTTISGTGCSTGLCFDAFDPDSTGFPATGEDCNPNFSGSTRWFFGSTYCNMFSTNDMDAGGKADPADRMQTAWWWQCAGQASQSCFIAIQTFDTFDKTCNGPDRSNFLGGVILGFGALTCAPGGYYFTDVDLCLFGIDLPKPAAKGAYDIILAQAFDSSTGILTLADCAQPMLWGTDGHFDTSLNGPGTQNAIQWDDDNPIDGTHTAIDECYDYTFGLCPEPLCSMFCLYSPGGGGSDCITLDVPTLVAGSPATFSGVGQANQLVAVNYAFGTQGGISGQQGNFCAETLLNPPTGNGTVFTTSADGAGNYSQTVPVPGPAQGLTVNFQAYGSGTCPDPCDSDVVTRTVL